MKKQFTFYEKDFIVRLAKAYIDAKNYNVINEILCLRCKSILRDKHFFTDKELDKLAQESSINTEAIDARDKEIERLRKELSETQESLVNVCKENLELKQKLGVPLNL